MKKSAILALLGAVSLAPWASAQEAVEAPAAEEENFYGSVSLNQDTFFGFYPVLAAGYEVADDIDFTFYSILWTTPSFSAGALSAEEGSAPNGGGLWTEVGVGANFRFMDDQISLNPQLGLLNGGLLSQRGRPLMGEGIVPNLTANYDGDYVEAEIYFGYYLALRSPRTADFIHYWANAGAKPFGADSLLSVGIHWEHLRLARLAEGDAADIYKWIGPYVSFNLPRGVSLQFAGGLDIEDSGMTDFYKASIGMDF
jgi:hypothetical protein